MFNNKIKQQYLSLVLILIKKSILYLCNKDTSGHPLPRSICDKEIQHASYQLQCHQNPSDGRGHLILVLKKGRFIHYCFRCFTFLSAVPPVVAKVRHLSGALSGFSDAFP